MKLLTAIPILMISFLFTNPSLAQINKFFFSEFAVSINRSVVSERNNSSRLGYGFALLRSTSIYQNLFLTYGFEYNSTSQFKEQMDEGRYADSKDVLLRINHFSIPLSVRVFLDKKKTIFLSTGVFYDQILSVKKNGIMRRYAYNPSTGASSIEEYRFKSADNPLPHHNYGYAFGLGSRFHLGDFIIGLSAEYKIGLKELELYRNTIRNNNVRINISILDL